jgi:hypothetical protein
MSTRTEKIRKLRALAHSGSGAFPHEAAVALRMAEALDAKTPNAKAVAQAVAKVLKERGMTVRVRRRAREDDWRGYYWQGMYRMSASKISPVDADVSYLRNRVYIELNV